MDTLYTLHCRRKGDTMSIYTRDGKEIVRGDKSFIFKKNGMVDLTSTVLALMSKEMYSLHNSKGGASTDTKGNIWLPPIPESANTGDLVKYFTLGMHEGAHNMELSDCSLMSRKAIEHHWQNCIDDIRIENVQCEKYSGLTKYYREMYLIYADEHLCKRFAQVTVNNISDLINSMTDIIIIHSFFDSNCHSFHISSC